MPSWRSCLTPYSSKTVSLGSSTHLWFCVVFTCDSLTDSMGWSIMRASFSVLLIVWECFINCVGQSHNLLTVLIDHIFWRERRAEKGSNRGPSPYQPNALPLGQTGIKGNDCLLCCEVRVQTRHQPATKRSAITHPLCFHSGQQQLFPMDCEHSRPQATDSSTNDSAKPPPPPITTHTHNHARTHTHNHARTHTHTHTPSPPTHPHPHHPHTHLQPHPHTHPPIIHLPTHPHPHTHSHTHTYSLSLSLSHTHTHTLSLCLSHPPPHTHTPTPTHTHTHPHPPYKNTATPGWHSYHWYFRTRTSVWISPQLPIDNDNRNRQQQEK